MPVSTMDRGRPPHGHRSPAMAYGWQAAGPLRHCRACLNAACAAPAAPTRSLHLVSSRSSSKSRAGELTTESHRSFVAAAPLASNSSRALLRCDPLHLVLPSAAANVKVRGRIGRLPLRRRKRRHGSRGQPRQRALLLSFPRAPCSP
jgi:hypothetical protein